MKIGQTIAAAAIALAGFGISAASANVIVPVSATGSSNYPGYNDFNAIDQGGNSANTDWAAYLSGAGPQTYLDLNLGAVYILGQATVTDRVTSGGGNDAFFGGLYDFTTQFTLQAYTDSSFSTTSGLADTFTISPPSDPNAPGPDGLTYSDFTQVVTLAGVSGQYIRYTVDSTLYSGSYGQNPGLSNIYFDGTRAANQDNSVPEPITLSVFGAGLAAAAALRGRKKAGRSSAKA